MVGISPSRNVFCAHSRTVSEKPDPWFGVDTVFDPVKREVEESVVSVLGSGSQLRDLCARVQRGKFLGVEPYFTRSK